MAKKEQFGTVAIVGVGLIGGSIGMGLLQRGVARQVVGIGRRSSTLRVARQRAAITRGSVHLDRGVADADLVVVCAPVGSIVPLVCQVAECCKPGTLITDAGGTKAEIVRQLDGQLDRDVRFLGSHPLAGGEQSGPMHAQADLLVNRTVIVTPTRRSREDDRHRLRDFWTALGAKVVEMSPAEHDRCVATVSHLPHLAAAAVAASTPEKLLEHVATGWRDTTRVAAGDVDLWMDIILTNRSHILKSLDRFETLVHSIHDAIDREDAVQLRRILTDAKRKRDALGS